MVSHSVGSSARSEASFFCLGSGLVCFRNSVCSCPNKEAFCRRVVVVIISSFNITIIIIIISIITIILTSIICSAASIASRSVEMVRCSSGPASCRVRRPACARGMG